MVGYYKKPSQNQSLNYNRVGITIELWEQQNQFST